MADSEGQKHGDDTPWFLKSSYAVWFPHHDALTMSQPDFESFLISSLCRRQDTAAASVVSETLAASTGDLDMCLTEPAEEDDAGRRDATVSPFVRDYMSSENQDAMPVQIAEFNSASSLAWCALENVHRLMYEFPDIRTRQSLERAWAYDPHVTLKAMFHARSIHVGVGQRYQFYNAVGWLAQHHPLTLIANLQWLVRPVIKEDWVISKRLLETQKVLKRREEATEDVEMVDSCEKDAHDPARFDVKNGMSHGCWKDLLNILVLAAKGELHALSDDSFEALNKQDHRTKKRAVARQYKKHNRDYCRKSVYREWRWKRRYQRDQEQQQTAQEEKDTVHMLNTEDMAVQKDKPGQTGAAAMFESDPLYRALHITVARMFAEQLKSDLEALRGGDVEAKKKISICGKWAPSHKRFHDRHTLIVTSIAEVLNPPASLAGTFPAADAKNGDEDDARETYLRYAREEYRKDVSALRKHLDVVERKITAKDYASIDYNYLDISSLKRYTTLFVEKDRDRFVQFMDSFAAPEMRAMNPKPLLSSLIKDVVSFGQVYMFDMIGMRLKRCLVERIDQLEAKAMDAQWQAIVERCKQLEIFSSSIAVCDTSGFNLCKAYSEDTSRRDTALGLTVLMATLAPPPFSNAFLPFHPAPFWTKINPEDVLGNKAWAMLGCSGSRSNTNFATLFEKIILRLAVENHVPPDKMIKHVFVLCEKPFPSADKASYEMIPPHKRTGIKTKWSASYERIKKAYEDAGYQIPELIFWNLAGDEVCNSEAATKPSETKEPGARLVNGFSEGMLRRLLKSGSFDAQTEDEEEEEEGMGEVVEVKKPSYKMMMMRGKYNIKHRTPWVTQRWIMEDVMHKAFDMLQVVD